jgi:hypothetical protein
MLASGTAEPGAQIKRSVRGRRPSGGGCGRGSPLPTKGVRGCNPGKFFKLHMATDAF